MKILVRTRTFYQLDLRALSLMRIGLALIILADLLIRGSDISAMYTDEGWWPVRVVNIFGFKTGYWSLHLLSGSYTWQLILFAFHFMLALFLLAGLRTRVITILLWLLTISLHNRNLYINQSGDDLLRLMLFIGIFLPWNAYYSIDSKKRTASIRSSHSADLAYLLLIASVYFFTVNLKSGPEWRQDFTAIYYALSLEQLRLPFIGEWIYHSPALMKALTVFVYLIELLLPILILSPSRKGHLRLIAFVLLLLLHLGIGTTLYVGLFFLINIVTAIGLIPSFAMDAIEKKIKMLKGKRRSLLPRYRTPFQRNIFRPAARYICLFFILLSLFVNLSTLTWFRYELADAMNIPVNTFRFNQNWGMFSPNIIKREGWFVHYGMDSIGRQWDMIRNEDYVNFEKPKSILKMHKSDRWRKLTENLQREDMYFLRPLYCKYLLRRWNKKHPEKQLNSLSLYYMERQTLPGYMYSAPQKKVYCVCDKSL